MASTLTEFVSKWNKECDHFSVTPIGDLPSMRPIGVEVRYSAVKYRKAHPIDAWNQLNDLLEAKSNGTMYIATSERLFEHGILDIKIASENDTYREAVVIGTLKWLIDQFFASPENTGA